MSKVNTTQLPDIVQGSASVTPGDNRSLRVSATTMSSGMTMLHAHIGGIYIGMTEQNWRILIAAISLLEPEVKPRNFRAVFDDEAREAKVVTA